ncbi:MAG: YifB family Mg chelatase-like AAA ATPase [Rikenellaceae bacterium]
MFIKVYAGAIAGIDAVRVTVEVNMAEVGLGLWLVGLPDNTIKESQERIRSAFENSSLSMPNKKIVVNLAPADLRKEGSGFDLPIAMGILAASGQIQSVKLEESMILGELSLDGSISSIKGALPMAAAAKDQGFKRIILPIANSAEAAVVEGIEVLGVRNLREVVDWANDLCQIEPTKVVALDKEEEYTLYSDDFSDVKGQSQVKRAFEIAAAGGHNIIMIGAPGSGKTMLSKRMPTILPPMSQQEALETTKIYSVAGKLGVESGLMTKRPFRAPHHITSQVALIGGGNTPQPGEVSLANNGILFLDELPEFGRAVLEVLRQPLEEKSITIARARYTVEYPANFTLVASMNPCPCGYYNHPTKECTCSPGAVHRYLGRISGPLLDRIDLHIEVTPLSIQQINEERVEESSAVIRERVIAARAIQTKRFKGLDRLGVKSVTTNAMMTSRMLRDFCPLDEASKRILELAMERLQLSARAYDRIIKVARTIADLAGEERINSSHIAEAIGYRNLDRDSWGR